MKIGEVTAIRDDGIIYVAMAPDIARVLHAMCGQVIQSNGGGLPELATNKFWTALMDPLYREAGAAKDLWMVQDVALEDIRLFGENTEEHGDIEVWLRQPLPKGNIK